MEGFTKGDAVPIRFSKRIHRQRSLSLFKVSQKIRRSPVKKKPSSVNASFFKATKHASIGEKNKLETNSKQASKFLKQAFNKLKPIILKPKKNTPKISHKKRQTRNSLNASQINLTFNRVSSKNLSVEVCDKREKVIENGNHKKSAGSEKQSYRKSLRVSKSLQNLSHDLTDESTKVLEEKKCKKSSKNNRKSAHISSRLSKALLSPKGNRILNEQSHSDIKSSKERKPSQDISVMQVANMSSESSLLTPNSGKFKFTSKHSESKKRTRLSTDPPNQELSFQTSAFNLPTATPVLKKVAHISKFSESRKSARLSRELNQSRIMNSKIPLCTLAFQSLIETSQPDKSLEKRKSSRFLESSPLRTLNKEMSLPTHASMFRKNQDCTVKKSLKPSNSTKLLPLQTNSKKQGKCKTSTKDICTISNEKVKRKQGCKVHQHQKISTKPKKLSSSETENLPLNNLTTPVSKPVRIKSTSRSPKSKLKASTSENLVAIEKLLDSEKKKKIAGENVSVDNSTSSSKYRRRMKSVRPLKTGCTSDKMDYLTSDLSEKQISMLHSNNVFSKKSKLRLKPLIIPLALNDVLLSNTKKTIGERANHAKLEKQFRKRIKSVPSRIKKDFLTTIGERKVKSSSKKVKRLESPVASRSANDILLINSKEETWKTPIRKNLSKKQNLNSVKKDNSTFEITISKKLPENRSFNVIQKDCLTSDLCKRKHRRIKSLPQKGESRWIKILTPMRLSHDVNQSTESSLPNSVSKSTVKSPVNNLTTNQVPSLPVGNELQSKISAKNDSKNIPGKGTLKRKRWAFENLREKNENYEDDIFENENFNNYKTGFHFGEDSDGSSVNIATPKFDCILTPALPKKTPRFKDCMSPTEFLKARKSAEEYLYRRNKKRKSRDTPSSSGKKTSVKKKNITQDVPEKRKLDLEEAVNKLKKVQEDLEKEAEVDDEDKDSYFSDASN